MDDSIRDFVLTIICGIVDHPDEANCDITHDDRGILVTLSLHNEDMGRVIGKEGATAGAIRDIIRVFGAKHSAKISMRINDPRRN